MKYYLIFLLVLASLVTEAQTKQETENWIKEKLTIYFDQNFHSLGSEYSTTKSYYQEKNLQVTFSNCSLTIITDTYETYYSSADIVNNTKKKAEYSVTNKFIIDLRELKEVYFVGRQIGLKVEHRAVQHYMSKDHGKSYEKKENSETAYSGFDRYGEEDLGDRMIKAFKHLQSFCPSVKKQEAF